MSHKCILNDRDGPAYYAARKIKLVESAFVVPVVRDAELSTKPLIFFVHNTAEEDRGDGLKDSKKPAGFGNPGGGVKPDETPEVAVQREFRQEGGRNCWATRGLYKLGLEHSLLIPAPEGEYTRYVRCDQLAPLLSSGEVELDPDAQRQTMVHTFAANVSPVGDLKFLFHLRVYANSKAQGGADGYYDPNDPIVLDIDPEQAEKLEIVEAMARKGKPQEINQFGLFTEDYLEAWFFAYKAWRGDPDNLPKPDPDFYTSHLKRLRRALGKARSCGIL